MQKYNFNPFLLQVYVTSQWTLHVIYMSCHVSVFGLFFSCMGLVKIREPVGEVGFEALNSHHRYVRWPGRTKLEVSCGWWRRRPSSLEVQKKQCWTDSSATTVPRMEITKVSNKPVKVESQFSEVARLDSFRCLEQATALISLCSRCHSAAARRDTPQLPAGPQPWDRLGWVQRSGLAEPCQAQPCCPERCLSAAGLPEVRKSNHNCSIANHTSRFFFFPKKNTMRIRTLTEKAWKKNI